MIRTFVLTLTLGLVLSVPAGAQVLPSSSNQERGHCSVSTFLKGEPMAGFFPDVDHIIKASQTRTVYLCDAFYGAGSTMQITVPGAWFEQHCHTISTSTTTADSTVAVCDHVYEGAATVTPIEAAAGPPQDSAVWFTEAERAKVATHGAWLQFLDANCAPMERKVIDHQEVVRFRCPEGVERVIVASGDIVKETRPTFKAKVKDAAAPSRDHPHLKAIGYGALAVGVLAICVVGGCGFLGGGL